MKKNYMFMLCTILLAGMLCFTGCGNNNNNGNNGSEAPYQDETNDKVNGTDNNDGTMGGDLQDAGRNLMDSIKDTGDAIRDGVDNLGNGTNNRTNP